MSATGPVSNSRRWLLASVCSMLAAVTILVGFVALRYSSSQPATQLSAGDRVLEIAAAERGDPVQVSGKTLSGEDLDVAAMRGNVVVINVWGSWCAPCRAEAPGLRNVSTEFSDEGVRFVGINVKDNIGSATAFERNFAITYPSIDDSNGAAQLALADTVPPQGIPSTIVLDRQGRVAARAIGEVPESTLRALVSTVLAEPAGGQKP